MICSTEFKIIFQATSLRIDWGKSKGHVGEISYQATEIIGIRNAGGLAYDGTNKGGEELQEPTHLSRVPREIFVDMLNI